MRLRSHSDVPLLTTRRTEADVYVCFGGCVERASFELERTDYAANLHPARLGCQAEDTHIFTLAWCFPGMSAVLAVVGREGVAAGFADGSSGQFRKIPLTRSWAKLEPWRNTSARLWPLKTTRDEASGRPGGGHCMSILL